MQTGRCPKHCNQAVANLCDPRDWNCQLVDAGSPARNLDNFGSQWAFQGVPCHQFNRNVDLGGLAVNQAQENAFIGGPPHDISPLGSR